MMFGNKSVYVLTIIWNERRFVESKSARYAARRCLHRAANVLLQAELRNLTSQNNEILTEINRCQSDLQKYSDKLQILDNMTQLATQSLEVYFQTRMENLRTFVHEQCRVISDAIQEEADHWKEIHAMLHQKLVVPGDLRSYGGGNGLPRTVKQSPDFSRIIEEDEEEDNDDDDEQKKDVSILLQARTLTPLITHTLKNARLRASRTSHDSSLIIPNKLNMSTTVHEETINEEPHSPVKAIGNHMTLRDVSAIEKETEMESDIINPDLSVSLLPFVPTVNNNDDDDNDKNEQNKSIRSTISDKTFVKKSLKPSLSEEENDDDSNDEDQDTIIEETKENIRPLLLTADQTIRIRNRQENTSLTNKSLEQQPKIKQEKVSFREPIQIHMHEKHSDIRERNHLGKTFLLTNHTFDAEKSDYVRPTIVIHDETSKLLSPIASADSDEEKEEQTKLNTSRRIEKRSTDPFLLTSSSSNRSRTLKSPIVTQLPPPVPASGVEGTNKRRATRRTTLRTSQDNQTLQPQSNEIPTKSRYPTRYSTRLAGATITEETTTTTTMMMYRRTARLTSE